jgi:hypothetical protein
MDDEWSEAEIEIERLVMDLPEGDDPLAGQTMAQQIVRYLVRLLEE